jgi:hypothetical protein
METSSAVATIENRILLSFSNLSQYNRWDEENCQEDFNAEPPNQWVTYSNPNIEITFQIPSTPHSGSSRFRINPYDEDQPYIYFGPYFIGEACVGHGATISNPSLIYLLLKPKVALSMIQVCN